MNISNDRQFLQQLIAQGEHQQQDFKYKVMDAEKLARSVSAFANTDGGRLLIGVRDDGHISGIRSEEEIYMMHSAAYKYCTPQPSIHFDTLHAEGRNVVIATIPPSPQKPVFALTAEGKHRAYIRIADENIIASPVHLDLWRQETSKQGVLLHYSDDEAALMEVLKKHPPLTLNLTVRLARLPRHKVIRLLARFIRFDLATWKYEDERFLFSLAE
ncbi:MAG: ATP-binding protein [Prevotella sp.]|nr:ATP-binding protein [Prevotella sp.]MBR5730286.1 ATP-binding protein [Prevotella sp.]